MTTGKRILIVAGPNGAGKTTFAMEFLPHEADCPNFINADLIAAGLSPFRPRRVAVQAGRVMLGRIHEHATRGETFAFETTLGGRGFARLIPRWRQQGFTVTLFFLSLPTSEAAIARVRQRVLEGGHDVPELVIRRRFAAGWRNWERFYRNLVDEWAVYDNSRDTAALLEEQPAMKALDWATPKPARARRSALLAGAETALHRAARRAQRRARDSAERTRARTESDDSEAPHVAVTIRNPADPSKAWESLFRIDAAVADSLVPAPCLEDIGLRPKSRPAYDLSDGQ